ncbi:MAG: hypothetical protein AVO38_00800 [delta proteobacterium ML8_D]|jgi:hypothetical protein|nr:MAG: hypothetical protein AVO38_00800 [delta proteobacterium ML8_D]
MKKTLLILFALSAILILAVSGCRLDLKVIFKEYEDIGREKQEIIDALDASGDPDRELFKEYFSYIRLGDINILPTNETYLECGFNKKEEFEFVYTVFNPENGEFVKRCTNYASSEGSDGMVMEALEWTLLSPGKYEYRIYVEDKLVEAIPFKIISYTEYIKNKFSMK